MVKGGRDMGKVYWKSLFSSLFLGVIWVPFWGWSKGKREWVNSELLKSDGISQLTCEMSASIIVRSDSYFHM